MSLENKYISVDQYLNFISKFQLSDDDKGFIDKVIGKINQILILKGETCQTGNNLYLKYIMLPKDYRKIDKALKLQKEFKLDRATKKFYQELIKENKYSQIEIKEKIAIFRKELAIDLGIKYKNKIKKEVNNENVLTLNDIENIEEENKYEKF